MDYEESEIFWGSNYDVCEQGLAQVPRLRTELVSVSTGKMEVLDWSEQLGAWDPAPQRDLAGNQPNNPQNLHLTPSRAQAGNISC